MWLSPVTPISLHYPLTDLLDISEWIWPGTKNFISPLHSKEGRYCLVYKDNHFKKIFYNDFGKDCSGLNYLQAHTGYDKLHKKEAYYNIMYATFVWRHRSNIKYYFLYYVLSWALIGLLGAHVITFTQNIFLFYVRACKTERVFHVIIHTRTRNKKYIMTLLCYPTVVTYGITENNINMDTLPLSVGDKLILQKPLINYFSN